MDEPFYFIMVIVIVLFVAFCIGISLERGKRVAVCRENGFAGYDRIDRVPYCYGYTDGNQMFVKSHSIVYDAYSD